jgi:hypothetical protein
MNVTVILGLALLAVAKSFSAEGASSLSATPVGNDGAQFVCAGAVLLGRQIVPPPMPRRPIEPSTNTVEAERIELEDKGVKFTLFIPPGWTPTVNPTLTVHFHTAVWFTIQEHLRRGGKGPLICFQLGEGSTIYRRAFEDTNRLGRVLRLVEGEMKQRGAPSQTSITALDVSSFSAGYGAVRELLKSPENLKLIQGIVLLDSMYAAYEARQDEAELRKPAREQIDVWVPFARSAIRGRKTFVFTYSAVPTDKYASSSECALALVAALGTAGGPVEPGSNAAAAAPDFPLRYRSDEGNFHVWGYGGEDASAHLTHVRHMADVWRALEK